MEYISDLLLMLAVAIAFIYLIMVAQFQSFKLPFIVMFTMPLAFTGGIYGLFLTGQSISIIAMLGFLVLAGIVVNNGIVFIDSINQLREEGMERKKAIVLTGKLRFRPILMTALTTILGMLAMAIGVGKGAEMTKPLGIVTISGLVYSTLLTLYLCPVLYEILCKKTIIKSSESEDVKEINKDEEKEEVKKEFSEDDKIVDNKKEEVESKDNENEMQEDKKEEAKELNSKNNKNNKRNKNKKKNK